MKRMAGKMKRAAAAQQPADASKLVSLLALAAGAVAMPETLQADIIYTDLSSSPFTVGFGTGSGNAYTFVGLSGLAQFGFQTHQNTVATTLGTAYVRSVTAGRLGTVNARVQGLGGFAKPLDRGAAWNATNLSLYSGIAVAYATDLHHGPNGYSHKYLAWQFQDTTHSGDWRYGWIELSLANRNISGLSGGPDVTIYGYAYDDTGAKIPMGAVPEPGAGSLLALGALALGARGIRSWRRNRPAAPAA